MVHSKTHFIATFLVVCFCIFELALTARTPIVTLPEQPADPTENEKISITANSYWLSNKASQWDKASGDCKRGGEYQLSVVELVGELENITNSVDFERGDNYWLNARWSPSKKAFVWQSTRETVGDFIQDNWRGEEPYNPDEFTSQFSLVLTNTIEGYLGFDAQPDTLTLRSLCERPKKEVAIPSEELPSAVTPENERISITANSYWLSNKASQWGKARADCKRGGEYELSVVELVDELNNITNSVDFERGDNYWLNARWSPGEKTFVWQSTREPVGEFIQDLWSGEIAYDPNEFTSQFALVLTNTIEGDLGFDAQPDTLTLRSLCEKPKLCNCQC